MRKPKMVNTVAVCAGLLLFSPVLSFCQDVPGNTTVASGGFGASATIPETRYNTPARAAGNNTTQADNVTAEIQGAE